MSISSLQPFEKTLWCPFYELNNGDTHTASWTTVEPGSVQPELRDRSPDSAIPQSPANGGLYGGPQSNGPWANIPVAPTMTNLIHYNLRSANPPPGATEQYIGTDRLGNNYIAMPGVSWFNPNRPDMQGKYRMQVIN
jgi:hypothetical protein